MGYWDTNPISSASLNLLGPWVDEIVGTNGNYQDLKAAIDAGAKRILIAPGATLSAAVTLTGNGSFIINPTGSRGGIAFAYTITLDAVGQRIEGVKVSSATGAGIELGTNANTCIVKHCQSDANSSHGIHINNTNNDHVIFDNYCLNNGGDGIRIESGSSYCRVTSNLCYGNTGYGLNDLDNTVLEGSNRLDGNTAGSLNSTSSYKNGTSRAP